MAKLRRHDWRSHRQISCTICDEVLPSRDHIVKHRQATHRMIRRQKCKYFPECLDGDECLFDHAGIASGSSVCPNGKDCVDQSCEFTEQQHKNENRTLCIFQANCNRIGCPYIHNVERRHFLVEDRRQNRRA